MPVIRDQIWAIAKSKNSGHPEGDPAALDELRRLIKEGASLEECDEFNPWTAYMYCIRSGLAEAARILEEAGADASQRMEVELINAGYEGNPELARKALAAGARGVLVSGTMKALEIATFWGHPEVVQVLANAGIPVPADALLPLGEMDITDWMIDTEEDEQRYARVAEILIAHGASPDVKDHYGRPLVESFIKDFRGARFQCVNIVRVLSKGARSG